MVAYLEPLTLIGFKIFSYLLEQRAATTAEEEERYANSIGEGWEVEAIHLCTV